MYIKHGHYTYTKPLTNQQPVTMLHLQNRILIEIEYKYSILPCYVITVPHLVQHIWTRTHTITSASHVTEQPNSNVLRKLLLCTSTDCFMHSCIRLATVHGWLKNNNNVRLFNWWHNVQSTLATSATQGSTICRRVNRLNCCHTAHNGWQPHRLNLVNIHQMAQPAHIR